jgi:peptide/nickel transport system substrate-binding protein
MGDIDMLRKFQTSTSRTKALFAAALLSAGMAHVGPTLAQDRGTIRVALNEDIRGVDPARETDGMSDPVHMHIVEGLVAYSNTLEIAPVLAESYSVEDEGKTYIFKLRDGVKFHNGKVLTSADVKWSWDYLMAEGSVWRCKAVFEGNVKVASVETPDPLTVVYRLAEPKGSFIYSLARTDCAGTPVFHSDSLKADGSWGAVVGTGPFMAGERKIGEYAEVNRFPDYTSAAGDPSGRAGHKEALVDKIRFSVVTDPAARIVGLRSGELDLSPVSSQSVEQIKAEPTLDVSLSETTVWYSLLLSQSDPLLKNKALRQAIASAIDRDAVAQGVTYGLSKGTTTPMPRVSRYYSPIKDEPLAGNPDRTRELLAEAGYKGEPITIIANKSFQSMFDQAIILQAQLQAAGINVTIETLEWGLQLERYTKGNYQAQSFSYSGRFDPMGAWERIIGPESRKVWKDERAIALLNKGIAASNPDEVRAISDEIYALFMEEVPAVSLFHITIANGFNKRLQGIKSSPFDAPMLWNVSIK